MRKIMTTVFFLNDKNNENEMMQTMTRVERIVGIKRQFILPSGVPAGGK